MASFKDMSQTTRPLPSRPSMPITTNAFTTSGRHSHSRNGSSSLSIGGINGTYRVARRKSVTSPLANAAAVAAALSEAGDKAMPLPMGVRSRRSTMSKNGPFHAPLSGSLPSPPASLPSHKFLSLTGMSGMPDSAIDDDANDLSPDERDAASHEARLRRASDGSQLNKDGKKGDRADLRCQQCGKGYKHSSCLTKHLWEHTPEWSFTSKLLISKHQQVQLLEAASVLLTMNDVEAKGRDTGRDSNSDGESISPSAFGGSSDQLDGRSSADTTPPPQMEGYHPSGISYRSSSKRYSSGSGVARSYQSTPFGPSTPGSMPTGSEWTQSRRASQSVRRMSSEADHELAAAVELLSCSFGSSNGATRTVHLPADAPPVPPLPKEYLEHAALTNSSYINSFPARATESNTRGVPSRHFDNARMEHSGESSIDDDEEDKMSRSRSDEDDEGVFGRMEE